MALKLNRDYCKKTNNTVKQNAIFRSRTLFLRLPSIVSTTLGWVILKRCDDKVLIGKSKIEQDVDVSLEDYLAARKKI